MLYALAEFMSVKQKLIQSFLYWREKKKTNQTSSPWISWLCPAGSCFHGAKRHDDDQDHSAGGCCDQGADFTQLGPPELCLLSFQQ